MKHIEITDHEGHLLQEVIATAVHNYDQANKTAFEPSATERETLLTIALKLYGMI